MKKFLVSFLAMAIFAVQAQAATAGGLEQSFQELSTRFALAGEDKAARSEALKSFQKEVEGVSPQVLKDFALSQVTDEKAKANMQAALSLVDIGAMSNDEARKMIGDISAMNRASGANFQSDGFLWGVLLLVLLVAAASGGGSSRGGSTPGVCYDEYVCFDYYDSWGYYWYSDCYWQTYCY
jgi:hypothetical protein